MGGVVCDFRSQTKNFVKAGVGSRVLFGTALRVRCARCSSGARACDVAARGCASGRAWIDRGGSSLVCREVNGRARSVIRAELDRHARLPSQSPPRPSGRKAGGPGRTARFGREKTRACDRAVGGGDAHLEESGRDGRASVGLVGERLPGARDHRVRVVIPVEPRLVPGDVIADETGNEASVSANASIEFGRSRMGRSGRR